MQDILNSVNEEDNEYWLQQCQYFFDWHFDSNNASRLLENEKISNSEIPKRKREYLMKNISLTSFWYSIIGSFHWNQTIRVNSIWNYCKCHINRRAVYYTKVVDFLNDFYYASKYLHVKTPLFKFCECKELYVVTGYWHKHDKQIPSVINNEKDLSFSKNIFLKCIEICFLYPFENKGIKIFNEIIFAKRLIYEWDDIRCSNLSCRNFLWYPENIWDAYTYPKDMFDWDYFFGNRDYEAKNECIKNYKNKKLQIISCLSQELQVNKDILIEAIKMVDYDTNLFTYLSAKSIEYIKSNELIIQNILSICYPTECIKIFEIKDKQTILFILKNCNPTSTILKVIPKNILNEDQEIQNLCIELFSDSVLELLDKPINLSILLPIILNKTIQCATKTISYIPQDILFQNVSLQNELININGGKVLQYLDQSNENIVKNALLKSQDALPFVPKEILLNDKDIDFQLNLIKRYDGNILEHLNVKNNEVMKKAIQKTPTSFIYIKKRATIDLVYELIRNNPLLLEIVPSKYSNDVEIALLAIKGNPHAFRYIGKQLKSNEKYCKMLIYKAAKKDGHVIKYLPRKSSLRTDQKLIVLAMKTFLHAFRYADQTLKANKDFVINLIQEFKDRSCTDNMDSALRNDSDVVLNATLYIPWYIPYLNTKDEQIRSNKNIVIAMLKKNPEFFSWIPKHLQIDFDVALSIVQTDATYYKKLSIELQNNSLIKWATIEKSSDAIKFMTKEQIENEGDEFILKALKNNIEIFKKLPTAIRNNNKNIIQFVFTNYPDFVENGGVTKTLKKKYEIWKTQTFIQNCQLAHNL